MTGDSTGDQPRGGATFPVRDLLRSVDQGAAGAALRAPGRALTEKEIGALSGGRLAGKVRWLLQRRETDQGQLVSGMLRQAREEMERRREALRPEERAPAGLGCNWLSVGPRNVNGRIKCLAVHPSDGQTVYAGAADGGVWKTTDGGQSWTPKMHDQASLAIGALAIDPSNPSTIYAGTGEPVYLLSDGTVEPPGSADLAWFYEGVGIYESNDGGDTWTLGGTLPNDFVYRIAVDPLNPSVLLCAGYSATVGSGGLCRSANGGASWTTVAAGVFTDVLFDPINAGRCYAGQYNAGVLKSTDGGQTWVARNTGLPTVSSIGRVSLSLARANANVLYAKIESASNGRLLGVYRTGSAAEAPGGWAAVSTPGVDSSYVWWCSHVAADPADPSGNTVYAGGVRLARSVDGGATWVSVFGDLHADQHALVFDPANSARLYAANDGGVFRGTVTGGSPPVTWRKVSTGLTVTQFYDLNYSPASPSVFGGGAQDNGSMVSAGGLSWRPVFGADGGYVAFHPTDPHVVYVQSQLADIQRSDDGANSFTSASSGISGSGVFPATVMAIDPTNPLTLFAGTDQVFRTTNGGTGSDAWSPASQVIGNVTELAIAPSSSAVVYAGTIVGGLYRATDGGATPTSFSDVTPAVAGFPTRWLAGITVHPTDANTLYVSFLGFNGAGTADQVWKGAFNPATSTWTWTMRTGGLPNVPAGAILIHPGTLHLYLATDVGVFRSVDDGAWWAPFEAGLPNTAVVDLALDPVRDVLRAATHGRGMYEIRLGATPCPEVDVYLRDNLIDTGQFLPSADGVPDPTRPGAFLYHYQSADIKVDAPPFDPVDALVDGVEFDNPEQPSPIETTAGITHDNPVRGQTNHVYVQVHNRGWNTASSVTVKLLYADAGAGLPALPADFWPAFPGDGSTRPTGNRSAPRRSPTSSPTSPGCCRSTGCRRRASPTTPACSPWSTARRTRCCRRPS